MSRNEMHDALYSDKILVRGANLESQEKQVRVVPTEHEAPLYSTIEQRDVAGLEAHHPDLPMVADKWDNGKSRRAGWRTFSSSHKNLLWVLATIIAGLLIIGAVVGGVLRSRHHHNDSPPASASGNGSTPSTGPAYKAIRQDSQLAAVAFNDTSGSMQYRVYFQDSTNFIKESSWNSTSQRWFVSNNNVTKAKPSTPIAAAAVGPGNMNASNTAGVYSLATKEQYINLFFLDEKSRINELYTTSNDFRHWSSGTLTARNFLATETSALTALWHADSTCTGCPNTLLLVYEDQTGQAQLVNGTEAGWASYPLSMNPGPQSGLSLVMMRNSGFINPLRLYYQLADRYMASHDWESPEQIPTLGMNSNDPEYPDSNGWENRESSPLAVVAPSAPLAALTTDVVDSSTDVVEVLTSSPNGIDVNSWTSWYGWNPTQSPAAMSGADNYTAIAAHGDTKAYMLRQGRLTEFEVDFEGESSSWKEVGVVATN